MKHTYWNGKTSKEYEELSSKMVDIGYTENSIYNAYIAASKIYYDLYNNGGGNLTELNLNNYVDIILNANIGNTFGGVNLTNKHVTIYSKLMETDTNGVHINAEVFIDEIIQRVHIKNVSVPSYNVWQNYEQKLLSDKENTGKDWTKISFGLEDELNKWVDYRLNHFEFSLLE